MTTRITLRTDKMLNWSGSKRLLLFLFCFAYTVASVGIFYFRPSFPLGSLSDPSRVAITRPELLPVHVQGEPVVNPISNKWQTNSNLAGEEVEVVAGKKNHVVVEQVEKKEVEKKVEKKEVEKKEVEKGLGETGSVMSEGEFYHVKNQEGLCMTLSKTQSVHGCPFLQFEPCKDGLKFAWVYDDHTLSLMEKCVDIFTDEDQVHACPCHRGDNQRWSVDGAAIKSNFRRKFCLTSSGQVSPKSCGATKEQEWFFTKVANTWSKPLDIQVKYPGFPKEGLMVDGVVTYADQKSMDKVKEMMLHAWTGYVAHAWGHDELRPVSNTARDWMGSGMSATIIDSLDTLYIMGLMDEYKEARDYVEQKLTFDLGSTVSFFETVIRALGGLLAAYGLTGDQIYVDKARDLGDRLLVAFNSPSGLPYGQVNLRTGSAGNHGWAGGNHIQAEVGTIQLEFKYLSEVTGDKKYAEKVNHVMEVMKPMDSRDSGLYPVYIPESGAVRGNQEYSMGGLGDSYYEYLLKQWLQTGRTESRFKTWYDESSQGIKRLLVGQADVKGEIFHYLGKYNNGYLEPKMEHLACFGGGMFALGAATQASSTVDRDMTLGAELTKTCRASYAHSASHLGCEKFQFSGGRVEADGNGKYYILRPEYVESLFYMWRLTKDPMYRSWGWDVIVALETSSRTDTGFSGLDDSTQARGRKNDVQESFFMAETLKYLYLLFTDDDVIPLDRFVFNTEAHPLPVFVPTVFHFQDST